MENLKLTQEIKYFPSIKKWCCGLWCYRGENKQSILENGFHKKLEKAQKIAMDNFKKSLAFHKELEVPFEKSEIII